MPPKKSDEDSRGAKAKAQKAAAAAEKSAVAARKKESDESAAWMDGANVRAMKKTEEAAREAAEREARKREKEELLKREEAELESARKLRGSDKVAVRKTAKASEDADTHARIAAPSLVARTIEDAIAVLSVATGAGAGEETSHHEDVARVAAISASVGAPSLKVDDKHPERRMKAAFKRYEERELPLMQKEYPSLRRSQLNEMIFRKWQKSPENPMNSATVKSYDSK